MSKRNEVPIDLTGFTKAMRKIELIEQQIAQLDQDTLPHWLKLLPPATTNTRKVQRLLEAA